MTVLKNPNKNKNIEISFGQKTFLRFPVKTQTIKKNDDLKKIFQKEAMGFLKKDDIVLVAESVISIAQGRAYKFSEIKFGKTAVFLSKFVTRTPAGIGLGTPQTMQLAINESGYLRILFAALLSAVTKPLGIKGVFYSVAGHKARGIDGPTDGTLPPYNEYASLIPSNPKKFSKEMETFVKEETSLDVSFIVVDANDIGVNILGAKTKKEERLGEVLASDNPMGQGSESTPFLICRERRD
jgi:F420-0:gamma-glutamyl ligase